MYYGNPLLGTSSSILSGLPDSPSILLAVTIASHQTLSPKANATQFRLLLQQCANSGYQFLYQLSISVANVSKM